MSAGVSSTSNLIIDKLVPNEIKQLIILGNGFDLAAELPTTYKLFLTSKLNNINYGAYDVEQEIIKTKVNEEMSAKSERREVKSIAPLIFTLVAEQLDNYFQDITFETTTPDISRRLGISEQLADANSQINEAISFIKHLNENGLSLWEIIFLTNSEYNDDDQIYNWQDIESEISNLIRSIRSTETNENFLKRIKRLPSMKFTYSDDILSREVFITYLFYIGTEKINAKTTENELISLLATELAIFENSFRDYLIGFQKKETYKINSANLLRKITGDQGLNFNLLNFNYTQPELNLQQKKDEGENSIWNSKNVHGVASKDSEIIFGITNTNIDANRPDYSLTKAYRTMRNRNNPQKTLFNKGIKRIKFYGHSFGEADYGYFFEIFNDVELLNLDVKLEFYYSIYDEDSAEHILMSQKLSVAKLLETYAMSLQGDLIGKTILTQLNNADKLELIEI